ncbi:MAG: VapC toxin family PIN domain ribonuclease [Acidiphilium sp. 37-64-53]|uniref:type II toxin-antitoxin system VapC family toxin n=1 Tax=Acidiphilium TaxID=522 RepID=UPI000BC52137|nr:MULTISPECIES: type II toxin-antitoxin system VapC family toxin [Acidiphilium]OYW01834.1 MAG: VapC toxin family PIN domain ribonuclease [Acidiphilium sp. 37-64-53]OZB27378.1 MAG: VapC toxin family PIN domain ribonuclease [Acidiphilium sp. 34-64-41]HQT85664.1 type II toxin-antitoxin system VapC family toxin [Acidiphilium rubrum]
MILLDTNLVSEPWKPQPDPQIVAWLDAQAVETLYLSAITVAELRFGIAAMPAGKRRKILHERLEDELLPIFTRRVLPFDLEASRAYADLMSKAKTAGQAINMADGSIAAIAAARGFSVASRDVAPFHAAGIPVINPWATVV